MKGSMQPTSCYGDRARFRAGRIPRPLQHNHDTIGIIVQSFGRQAPVAGLIHAELPIVGAVWVSPGYLERVEEK
jgi:hypothetical protein